MPNFEGKFLEYLKSVIFKGDGSVSGGTGPTYPYIKYLHAYEPSLWESTRMTARLSEKPRFWGREEGRKD